MIMNALKKTPRGFSLIEMMVAVTLFAIVMMVGIGALLTLVEGNKRAQSINSVINNLNAALEGMSRSIRVGTTYHCRTSEIPPTPDTFALAQNCINQSGKLIAFESATGNPSDNTDQVVYRINGTQLERSLDSGQRWVALTAPEVQIDSFELFVVGARSPTDPGGDTIQPRVVIKISGSAEVPGGTTSFSVQAGVTQRLLDI
jgi:prepilin-type N-terminal cleavage/methylation domain-containing protein